MSPSASPRIRLSKTILDKIPPERPSAPLPSPIRHRGNPGGLESRVTGILENSRLYGVEEGTKFNRKTSLGRATCREKERAVRPSPSNAGANPPRKGCGSRRVLGTG